MNKIIKELVNGKETYSVERDGLVEACVVWYEKSKDKTWVRLPKEHKSGRQYIAKALVDVNGEYEFEDKTTGPRVLSTSWRMKLTTEELEKLDKAEKTIEELKKIGQERVVKEPTKKDLENELERLKAQLAELRGEKK